MKKKIVITGGAGFIGSNLIAKLIGDFEIVVIDNFDPFYIRKKKEQNISSYQKSKGFYFFDVDIRDKGGLESVFSQFKDEIYGIIHLAGKAGVRPSILSPDEYMDVNVKGTVNMLEMAREYNIKKFIFASSSSVYGNCDNPPFVETQNINKPISPYAASKVAGEALCYTYHHLYDINMICFRFFTVYGPNQRPDLAIHKFCNLIYNDQPIQMYGNGSTMRDYTYVDDICDGIYKALSYDKSGYEIMNLGNSNPIDLASLIKLIENGLGKKANIQRESNQPGDVDLTCADITKSQKLIAYNPATKIEDGIGKFVDWFLTQQKRK